MITVALLKAVFVWIPLHHTVEYANKSAFQWYTKIWFINSVDKPNFRVSLPHRRSTTVSLETNPLSNDSLVESFKPVLGSKPHSLYTTQLNTQIKVLSNDSLVENFKPVLGFKSRQPFHSKMVQLPTFCKFWTLVT